jgi:hypothetical protein
MTGMTLRADRLLCYVSAFCLHCHAEAPAISMEAP